ncbi:MAG: glycosyltransferase family 2 protein [bacterium]|nr:glycosyltransferase family 2 protein [bacterium]
MSKPLISVITATYNSGASLDKTIISVLKQSYEDIEHIIIDGGSKDNTLEVLKKYENNSKVRWISESDKGISDAFNKGLEMAQGEYINFQGAGDCFAESNVIEKIMQEIDLEKDMLICGRIKRVTKTGELKYISPLDFKKWKLIYKMGLPHQALFTNKRFFQQFGNFDLDCKYAMDYDLLLRAYLTFPEVILKDIIVSEWEEGGIGQGNTTAVLNEYHRIKIKNHIAPIWLICLVDFIIKIKYKKSDE